jgi:glycosyltransferase involved in cell wall biosynthesis
MQIHNAQIIVCIPAYNEAKSVADIIQRAKNYASEVIVYDDGSSDNTNYVAKAAGATVIRHPTNKGYGAAIKKLFQAAKEKNVDIIITLDADGQHNTNQIPDIIEPILNDGFDIVIGSRFLRKEDKERVPTYRSVGIKTITKIIGSVSHNDITDAQSGFRAYSKNALSKIDLFEEGMAVSTEILLKAKEKNLLVKEVPITINYDVEDASTQNPITHGVGVLSTIVQYISFHHPLRSFGLVGIALLSVSALFMSKALELFTATRYVSTNLILVSTGTALVGMLLLATGTILYTLMVLLRGRLQ